MGDIIQHCRLATHMTVNTVCESLCCIIMVIAHLCHLFNFNDPEQKLVVSLLDPRLEHRHVNLRYLMLKILNFPD